MKPQLPKHVLFDLDGTILDSFAGIVFSIHQACLAVGQPTPQMDIRSLLGPPIRTILSQVACTSDVSLLDELERRFRISYDIEGWKRTSCFPHVKSVLNIMQVKGHRIFVVSNKPRHISMQILQREQLSQFFERIYTRDSRVPTYSSKEEMIREFLEEYDIPPSDCLVVGDTIEDIDAAVANHVAVALMEHGYGSVPNTYPAEFRLQSFSDFLPYVTVENAK